MMEQIERELISLCLSSILMCLMIISCHYKSSEHQFTNDDILECVLSNFTNISDRNMKEGSFLVGQQNGWTKNSSLIIISYISKEELRFVSADLKSKFKQKKVFFYQNNLNETDLDEYPQFPNKLNWEVYSNQTSKTVIPIFDPPTIQLVYNYSKGCIERVIQGKHLLKNDFKSKCKICIK